MKPYQVTAPLGGGKPGIPVNPAMGGLTLSGRAGAVRKGAALRPATWDGTLPWMESMGAADR